MEQRTKNLVIVLVVLLLITAAAGTYYYFNKTTLDSKKPEENKKPVQTTQYDDGSGLPQSTKQTQPAAPSGFVPAAPEAAPDIPKK
jgi:flagellar basal body-associated protein FliL